MARNSRTAAVVSQFGVQVVAKSTGFARKLALNAAVTEMDNATSYFAATRRIWAA